MANDPMDFISGLVKALQSFTESGSTDPSDIWRRATEPKPKDEPSPAERRENLMFALANRAVEALEDIALNLAAVRQRLERKETD